MSNKNIYTLYSLKYNFENKYRDFRNFSKKELKMKSKTKSQYNEN